MSDFNFEAHVIDIRDYPELGVVFKDITPLFADSEAMKAMVQEIAGKFKDAGVTKVVGPEARGFMTGAPVAYELDAGFVPARKPGKLPRETYSVEYALEYGTDSLEIHKDALVPGDRVLIVDDLIATGGTAAATAKLIQEIGGEVVGFACILELEFLNPRIAMEDVGVNELFSLIQVK